MGILDTMRFLGDVSVLRGSAEWLRPLRVKVSPPSTALTAPAQTAPSEFDEEGRLFVFRYARTAPQECRIDRDRIFDYLRRRRLPDAGQRQIRRDLRNRADFFSDVRELQTPNDAREA